MTIRVSRDSGQTFGGQVVYRVSEKKPLKPEVTHIWPPCQCHRCKQRRSA
ncbi:hypothetical protein [Streptomyces sp. NPDC059928]